MPIEVGKWTINTIVDNFIKTDDSCYLIRNHCCILDYMKDEDNKMPEHVRNKYIRAYDCYKIDCNYVIETAQKMINRFNKF